MLRWYILALGRQRCNEMRQTIEKHVLQDILEALAHETTGPGTVYLVGGTCAVWYGWRQTTIDLDIYLMPEPPGFFAAVERVKQRFSVNIKWASPGQFVPELQDGSSVVNIFFGRSVSTFIIMIFTPKS